MKLFHRIVPSLLCSLMALSLACASPNLPPKAGADPGDDTSGSLADAADPGDAVSQDVPQADSLKDGQVPGATDVPNNTDIDSFAKDADSKCTGGAIEGCPCDIKKDKNQRCCLQIDRGLLCGYVNSKERYEWGVWWDGCGCSSDPSENVGCMPEGTKIYPLCPSTIAR